MIIPGSWITKYVTTPGLVCGKEQVVCKPKNPGAEVTGAIIRWDTPSPPLPAHSPRVRPRCTHPQKGEVSWRLSEALSSTISLHVSAMPELDG